MKPKLFFSILFLVNILFYSCDKEPDALRFDNGFPETPVNFSLFNSQYDDYNSNLPPGERDLHAFAFSSNRNSKGEDFDIILKSLSISYVLSEQVVKISQVPIYSNDYMYMQSMLETINTSKNEFGPNFFHYPINRQDSDIEGLFLYTQDSSNHFTLKFMAGLIDTSKSPGTHFYIDGSYSVNILNSTTHNIGYASIQNNKIYFNSDKDGSYDIYELEIDTSMNIIDFLTQNINLESQAKKIVSSISDDKCPFVIDNLMVFTSNKKGGIGGFDLWYSTFENGSWLEPINFGKNVNSEKDEYRPIFRKYNQIPNDLMLFSSNRDGGQGGFDLYLMGSSILK